jgi:hypothetical protein
MNKLSILIALSGTAGTALFAQAPTLTTDGVVGIAARNNAGAMVDAIPPSTNILRPVALRASTDQAGASLDVGAGAGTVAFVLRETGFATPQPNPGASAFTHATPRLNPPVPALHAFLLAYTGPAVRIPTTLTGDSNGGGRARLAIDVGNDASIEFNQGVDGTPHVFEFVIGGTGATVARVVAEAIAAPNTPTERATYLLNAAFDVLPAAEQPCRFIPYGQGCDGAAMTGNDRLVGPTHNIEVNVTGIFPNSPVALLFGLQPLNLQIPGFRCNLLVDPVVSLPIFSDANGNLDNSFFVTGDLAGNTFIQAIAVRRGGQGLELRSTNGVRMDCGL